MANPQLRSELEQRIIEAGEQVDASKPKGAWIYDPEFLALEHAWQALVDYYESNADDSVIGVEVLREYLDFTRLLRRIVVYYDDLTDEHKENILDAIGSLEGSLGDIIREVVTVLNSFRPRSTDLPGDQGSMPR